MSDRLNITVDLAVHGLILFSFLTTFFLMYISKIEKDAMTKELNNAIDNGVKGIITDARQKYGNDVDLALDTIPFNSLLKNYTSPDAFSQANNAWLKEMLLVVNGMIFVMVVGGVMLLKKVCGQEIHVAELLKVNAITFACVGVIEYLFFTRVALNYVPTLPSTMVNTILGTSKKYFSK